MIEKDPVPVRVTQCYRPSPEIAFDAWLNPEIKRKWLFVCPSIEITGVVIHPEVRGSFSILEYERNNEQYIDHYEEYPEITRPYKLVFTLSVPSHFPTVTFVTVDIEPKTGGCELKFTQTGVEPAKTEANWRVMLQQLDVVLNTMC